jgi:hypothetical protein
LNQGKVNAAANKKMDVIRHDDVSAEPDSTLFAQFSKFDQARVHPSIGKQFPAPMSVKSYEIQWRIVFLKHQVQSRRPVGHSSDRAL